MSSNTENDFEQKLTIANEVENHSEFLSWSSSFGRTLPESNISMRQNLLKAKSWLNSFGTH